MKDYFTYNIESTIPSTAIRISPSQLSKFFDYTSQWYRETLLGESGFLGSTASELGNCVHAAAAMAFDTGHVDMQQIRDYISSISNPDVDKSAILDQLPHMIPLISRYLRSWYSRRLQQQRNPYRLQNYIFQDSSYYHTT